MVLVIASRDGLRRLFESGKGFRKRCVDSDRIEIRTPSTTISKHTPPHPPHHNQLVRHNHTPHQHTTDTSIHTSARHTTPTSQSKPHTHTHRPLQPKPKHTTPKQFSQVNTTTIHNKLPTPLHPFSQPHQPTTLHRHTCTHHLATTTSQHSNHPQPTSHRYHSTTPTSSQDQPPPHHHLHRCFGCSCILASMCWHGHYCLTPLRRQRLSRSFSSLTPSPLSSPPFPLPLLAACLSCYPFSPSTLSPHVVAGRPPKIESVSSHLGSR